MPPLTLRRPHPIFAAMDKMNLSDAEWRERLTPQQYHVLREHGTERAFTGEYNANKAAGIYHCAGCGLPFAFVTYRRAITST